MVRRSQNPQHRLVVRPDAMAAEHEANLLVDSAYGQTRVLEWAPGGVTRDLLLRAGGAGLCNIDGDV